MALTVSSRFSAPPESRELMHDPPASNGSPPRDRCRSSSSRAVAWLLITLNFWASRSNQR